MSGPDIICWAPNQCHGSFRTARCINPDCDFRIESRLEMQSLFWDRLREGSDAAKTAKDAHGKDFPVCSRCSAPLRPAVTFFGEGMPAEFHLACKKDLPESDLVLVSHSWVCQWMGWCLKSLVLDLCESCIHINTLLGTAHNLRILTPALFTRSHHDIMLDDHAYSRDGTLSWLAVYL
eukprot:2775899-Rhodomonas_salina.2